AIISEILKGEPKAKISVIGYDNSYNYFKNKFKTWKTISYSMYGKKLKIEPVEFAIDNFFLPVLWLIETFRLKLKAKKFNPDLIISDLEPVGLSLAKSLKKRCIIVFGYDPALFKECPFHSPQLNIEAKYFEGLYNHADMVLIPKFFIKRRSILCTYINPIIKIQKLKQMGLEKKPIVVLLGGSGFGFQLAKKINALAEKFPEESFIIIGGRHSFKCRKNVKHFLFTDKYFSYLNAAKGVITLAGQLSLTECLYLKKPMLIFPIKGHIEQILNAYALKDTAMVSYGLNNLKKKIREFISCIPLLQKKMPLLKFNGAEQAAEIIIRECKRKGKEPLVS
ncbi:hypothetical protein HZB88_03940, partial [archaeon]|nr:hypothetical protein [archaeon]